jgi:6-pyruvoyltetrahydropterin/6-carboxytetrahydropterin synthase
VTQFFRATREIGIDAGHRVTNHDGKCANIHGHRYVIQATVGGILATEGSTEGMAGGMDFSFIKSEMMNHIDLPCDHGFIIWAADPLLRDWVGPQNHSMYKHSVENSGFGGLSVPASKVGKLYILNAVPTAENLCQHWFSRLAPVIVLRSGGHARLTNLRVFETPNCFVDFGEMAGAVQVPAL